MFKAALFASAIAATASAQTCGFSETNSTTGETKTWDFGFLTQGVDYSDVVPVTGATYNYFFNPCGVSNSAECAEGGFGSCQYEVVAGQPDPVFLHGLSQWPTTGTWTVDPGTGNARQEMPGYFDGCNRRVTYVYECAAGPLVATVAEEPAFSCNYEMKLSGNVVCNGFPGQSAAPAEEDGGLSGGSILLIILVVIIPLYIVLGCVYNIKTKGMSGVQACPQYEFWSDIPSLVKDGCSFTMSKIRGEGGSKQTYDEL